jgi:hypothetical protein
MGFKKNNQPIVQNTGSDLVVGKLGKSSCRLLGKMPPRKESLENVVSIAQFKLDGSQCDFTRGWHQAVTPFAAENVR